MLTIVLPIVMTAALAQVPNAAAAINAAKDARAKTEAAQKKNSEALDPQSKSAPAQGSHSGQGPQSGQGARSGQFAPGGQGVRGGQGAQPPAGAPAPAGAQPPAGGQAAAGSQGTAEAQPSEKAGPGYSYDPAGRRDPFVSLLGRGGDLPSASGSRPAGMAGLLINEVTLKGVLKSGKGDFIALLQAPDNHTYIVHAGDKVLDGMVKTITQDAIVFSQDVNDPLSLVKQREVRKTIRPEAR